MPLGQAGKKGALSGTDFDNALAAFRRKEADLPRDPALVPHQEIDDLQVLAATDHVRVTGRQLVDDFRLHNALHRG